MRREWGSDAYIGGHGPVDRGGATPPVARGGRQAPLSRLWAGATGRPGEGRQAPPVARWGGRQAPVSFFFGHGTRCKFEEKNYI